MSHPTTSHHRPPRAGLDPIRDPRTALSAIAMALHRPLRHETIVLLLDDARCGVAVVVVDGTDEPDDVCGVVECLAAGAAGTDDVATAVAAMIVATVRPTSAEPDATSGDVAGDTSCDTSPAAPRDTSGNVSGDVERWMEISDLAEQVGIELVEWFVLTGGDGRVRCPRDRLGEPPRW